MAFKKFGKADSDEWASRITDIMDEMMTRSFVSFRDAGTWQPPTNVYETRDAYYVCLELAGVNQDEIDVKCVDGRRVVVCGRRAQPRTADLTGPISVHAMEIEEGPFRREVELPDPIAVDRIEASYSKGFLWVILPRENPLR